MPHIANIRLIPLYFIIALYPEADDPVPGKLIEVDEIFTVVQK